MIKSDLHIAMDKRDIYNKAEKFFDDIKDEIIEECKYLLMSAVIPPDASDITVRSLVRVATSRVALNSSDRADITEQAMYRMNLFYVPERKS
ncbi:MAG: hypothetical protein PHS46_08525 [Candidatus Omnitrophica bacterium]|nr:hypothetical protein [Candidatus Omnitrophota bacterium]